MSERTALYRFHGDGRAGGELTVATALRIARIDAIERDHRLREHRGQIPWEPAPDTRCPSCKHRPHWVHKTRCALPCFICGEPPKGCPHPRALSWQGQMPGTVEVERYGLTDLDELAQLITAGVFVWHPSRQEWRRPAPECPNCRLPYPDFAHGVYEAIAATLAEPLRKAFDRHLAEHGCATPGHGGYLGGFGHCEEATRLFGMLPISEQVILG